MTKAENLNEDRLKKDLLTKWNGWGYRDTHLDVIEDKTVTFTGSRYDLSGKELCRIIDHMALFDIKLQKKYETFSQEKVRFVPEPIINDNFLKWIIDNKFKYSTEPMHRVNRSHGHLVEEIVHLRLGKCRKRIPDIVLWPDNHDDVVKIVDAANLHNVVIIPIGGGTSVSGALSCPESEHRCIVSLDLCRMNRILNINLNNMVCHAQSGIVGIDLEQQLNEKGLTTGHEPDSMEFSTLGGWVATRASGIRKNKYGNIEDLVVQIKTVTSKGVLTSNRSPRKSEGPDINSFILGSEGILGVVTEVTFKIFPTVQKRYISLLFHEFAQGLSFLREITKEKCMPASVRLHDNKQTTTGLAMLPKFNRVKEFIMNATYYFVFPYILRFNMEEFSGLTMCLEGTKEEISSQHSRLLAIAKKHNAIRGLEEAARHGYRFVHQIAYFRDFLLDYSCLGESFETSITWDKTLNLIHNVKRVCTEEAKRMGLIRPIIISCRLTQVYDCGVCLYFYLVISYQDMFPDDSVSERIEKALKIFEHIELLARTEIIASGGSISHHHGVGKLRKRFLPQMVGDLGVSLLQTLKQSMDPNNIFASGNLFDVAKL